MQNRWSALALLFAVRTSMAFQFQSVGALAPLLRDEPGLDLGALGLLIGLYLAPGAVLAVPGGAIGKRFGDRRVVAAALVLMILGGFLAATTQAWPALVVGRVLAGVGGVLLNVLLSKMVVDWFVGREIATAMGVFVNSWPFGIALALLILPPVGTSWGVSIALFWAVAPVVLGVLGFVALYRDAPGADASVGGGVAPSGQALHCVLIAGLIWGLYNIAVGMIFSFGATMLNERGWSPAAASATTSMTLGLVAISVPLGGFLADRFGRRGVVLVGGLLAFAVSLVVAARVEAAFGAFIALGFCCGLAAAPIMSLPARVLAAQTRAVGMGIYFMLFYVCSVAGPWAAGLLARVSGDTASAFDLGAVALIICVALVAVFEKAAAPRIEVATAKY